MDKIVTFFGFIQSVVTPSRRNGNTNGTSGSDSRVPNESFPKASVGFRQDSTDSGFNSRNAGLKDAPSGENNMDRAKTSAFTESKLDTLRGEVREIKSLPTRCSITKDEPSRGLVKMKFDSSNSPSVLPAVGALSQTPSWNASIKTVHDGDCSKTAGSTISVKASEGHSNLVKKGNLPSLNNTPGLTSGKQHQTKQTKSMHSQGKKDLKEKKDLHVPDIFSNAGKSFVQTNQLSVFDRSSFRKKPACVDKEPPVAQPPMGEDASDPANGRKSHMKLLKVKQKSKKKKKKKGRICEEPAEREAEQPVKGECQTAPENRMKVEQIGKVAAGSKTNTRGQRPGAALGRWIKRRGNKIAPAPFDDSASDVHEDIQSKEQGSMHSKARVESHTAEKQKYYGAGMTYDLTKEGSLSLKDKPTHDSCRTLLVSERDENVSVLMEEDEELHKETRFSTNQATEIQEVITSDNKLTERDQESQAFSEKTVKVETKTNGKSCRENVPDAKVTPPYPVKRDLLKETLENVSLAALNDDLTQKPKVTAKKQLHSKKLDQKDGHFVTLPVKDRVDYSKALLDCVEEKGVTIGFPKSPSSQRGHYPQSRETVIVKHRLKKTSEKMFSEVDGTRINRNGQNDADRFGAKRSLEDSKLANRGLPSKIKNSAMFDINQGALSVIDTDSKEEISELSFFKDSKIQKIAAINKRQGDAGIGTTSATRNPDSNKRGLRFINDPKSKKKIAPENAPSSAMGYLSSSFFGPKQAVRRLPTSMQQSSALGNIDKCLSTDSQPTKYRFNGGKPCLPSISPHRKQMVDDFPEKQNRKQQQVYEEDLEGWHHEDEPEEVKQKRAVKVRLPSYPAQWGPLPNERSSGRGGQEYCRGDIWKKPNIRYLSDSSSEDNVDLTNTEELPPFLQHSLNRPETPKSGLELFVDYPFPSFDPKEEEPSTWCRASRMPRPLSAHAQNRYADNDEVDLEDVEELSSP